MLRFKDLSAVVSGLEAHRLPGLDQPVFQIEDTQPVRRRAFNSSGSKGLVR